MYVSGIDCFKSFESKNSKFVFHFNLPIVIISFGLQIFSFFCLLGGDKIKINQNFRRNLKYYHLYLSHALTPSY